MSCEHNVGGRGRKRPETPFRTSESSSDGFSDRKNVQVLSQGPPSVKMANITIFVLENGYFKAWGCALKTTKSVQKSGKIVQVAQRMSKGGSRAPKVLHVDPTAPRNSGEPGKVPKSPKNGK